MDPGTVTRVLLVLAAFAPWLTLLPLHGVAAVLAHVVTLVAAFHGAGRVLGWSVRAPDVHPMLSIQWGLAAMLGLTGLAAALGIATTTMQAVLVCGFAGVHTALVLQRVRRGDVPAAMPSGWWLSAALLLALGVLLVGGAAGAVGARPFDDDGHVLAQLYRLRKTGALADTIGYPRLAQLGGQTLLASLVTIPGDVQLYGVLEPLACLLALGLACARLGRLWSVLVIFAAAALPFVPVDPSACWTAVALALALHVTLADEDPRLLVPLAVTAGALVTLRHELAPLGLTAFAFGAWRHRRDRRAWGVAAVAGFAVVAPLLLGRLAHGAPGVLAPRHGSFALRSLVLLTLAAPLVAVARLACSGRGRWFAVGAALTIAGIVSQATGPRPYALHFLWPVTIAAGLIAAIELARQEQLRLAAMLAAVTAIVIVQAGRDATGRARWIRRYLDLADNLGYVNRHGDHPPRDDRYDALLAGLPVGVTVAVWVASPERLPFDADVRFVDLRTPRTRHVRDITALLAAASARYVLVERGCPDDLGLLALPHRVIAERADLVLVEPLARYPRGR